MFTEHGIRGALLPKNSSTVLRLLADGWRTTFADDK